MELTEEDLFTLPDLYELLDFKSVVDCLFHIDRVAGELASSHVADRNLAEKYDFPKRIPPLKSQVEQPKEVREQVRCTVEMHQVKVHKISVGNYMFGDMKVHIKAINGKLSGEISRRIQILN